MDWLNYHHLRYFWTVAKEGSLARAAERLRVSPPSISEQIHALEDALGEKLFRREGRGNRLTDAGQVVFGYAEDIFAMGRELVGAVRQHPGTRTLRLHVGVVDSFPKLVTHEILKPAFDMAQNIHVICREGKMESLLPQLAAHRLDIVLADEPAASSANIRIFNHPLGEAGTAFCAEKLLANRLRKGFPRSLHEAPALLPVEGTPLRRALDGWFQEQRIHPRIVAEFEDLALMKVMAAEGRGFIAVPSVTARDALLRYGFHSFGNAPGCKMQFHAITAQRRIEHPAATLIANQARILTRFK
jgi:LysR family transcriptional activator of nhaA